MLESIGIFGMKTTLVETRDFSALATVLADDARRSVFFCNVHMLMLAQEDAALAQAIGNADVVFADGVPVAWLQKRLSGKNASVIRGYEMTLAICERAAVQGEKVGFIGSTAAVMDALVARMRQRFEGLSVAFHHCPPLMEGELVSTQAELTALKESGIRWLFVGLGCPKQEKWVAQYFDELDCNVLAVGAAFDWLSGQVSKPPRWMEKLALGWFYRLLLNPAKMWHRYLIYNSKFVLRVIRELMGKK